MNFIQSIPDQIENELLVLLVDSPKLWPLIGSMTPENRAYIITSWLSWDKKFSERLSQRDWYENSYIKAFQNPANAERSKAFWIQQRVSDTLVGHLMLHAVADRQDLLSISYTIFPDKRGQKLASDAIRLAADAMLQDTVDFVCAETDPSNVASSHSLLRAEFRQFGNGMTTLLPPTARHYKPDVQRYMKTRRVGETAWPVQPV